MRTPAGKECRYFYGDYYRGREKEECRLLNAELPPLPWKPDFCFTCPVPAILQANACTYMQLKPSLARPFPFIKQEVRVSPSCQKTNRSGFDPHIGCGECHPVPDVFSQFTEWPPDQPLPGEDA
ncbi:MAG: hypothetical protein JSV61_01325 [Anaerolineales bacterium]|nr:MAG: hypothetical protein JSV61_01325 [Anaerolineales bacterium]